MNTTSRQSGNVFFIIMIAIALFASLSYAIAVGGRSYGEDVTQQNIDLAATEIITFSSAMESTFTRARLQGYKVWGMDFSGPVWRRRNGAVGSSANATCTDDGCRMFGPVLGLTQYVYPNNAYYTQNTGTTGTFMNQGASDTNWGRIRGVGTDLPEIFLTVPHLNVNTCNAINRILKNGINNPPTDSLNAPQYANVSSSVSSIPAFASDVLGDVSAEVSGKTAFCVRDSASYGYFFYHVLAIN